MHKLTRRQEKIRDELGLNPKRVSPKGWHITDCPYCGTKQKFGVIFTPKFILSFNCFKCQEHGTGSVLLKKLGLTSLLEGYTEDLTHVENPFLQQDLEEELDALKDRHPPLGWRRVLDDDYLNKRGFEPWQYEKYQVGRTKLYSKLKDYVIFLVTEDGANKGYIARIDWDKSKIKQAEEEGQLVLRYVNEGGIDFGMLVFGLDEVTESTRNLILVEGITDKFNVERLLNLKNNNRTVVLCMFGKKISVDQLTKIKDKATSVKSLFLMFDPDAVEQSKRAGLQIESEWDIEVNVGTHPTKDPGEYNQQDLLQVVDGALPPQMFNQSVVGMRELRR